MAGIAHALAIFSEDFDGSTTKKDEFDLEALTAQRNESKLRHRNLAKES